MYHRSLLTFITVAEQGSFLQAAKVLYLTPASVMNQMNNLEKQLGIQLLRRNNQGTSLTAAGQSFYEDAKQFIQASQQAIQRARQIAQAEETRRQATIRVGTSMLRSCKPLMDLWEGIGHVDLPFQISIVPFDESPAGMKNMLSALGKEIDCFVSPCASPRWHQEYSIQLLHMGRSCVAVPRNHRLAKRTSLTWDDLAGETLILVQRGASVVLDQLRDEIERFHPNVQIADVPAFHGMASFNLCEQMNYMMEIPDSWADIHPALVTLPMDWAYQVAYGIIYAKEPTPAVDEFIQWVKPLISAKKPLPSNAEFFLPSSSQGP